MMSYMILDCYCGYTMINKIVDKCEKMQPLGCKIMKDYSFRLVYNNNITIAYYYLKS